METGIWNPHDLIPSAFDLVSVVPSLEQAIELFWVPYPHL